MNRIDEIETRLAEIASELETADSAKLTALEAEVRNLTAERDTLREEAERRQTLRNQVAAGAGETRRKMTPTVEERKDEDIYDSVEYRKAFMAHVISGAAIPAEYRQNQNTKTTDTSAVIPTTVLNRIIEKMETVGNILNLVTRTSYKGGVSVPTASVKPTATWVAEGAGSNTQKLTTGTVTFAYHKLRCAVSTSLEVDVMALPAFEATLVKNVSEAMVKALEASIISGDGTGKPKGILSETPADGQVISTDTPDYKTLVDAESALPQEYENGAVWCMAKKTFGLFAGLTDKQGQPIARVNYGLGGKIERFLLGRPVVLCDHVPTKDTAASTGAYAFIVNFADYVLNSNLNITIKKYEDNTTDDQITKAVMLVDGKMVDKNSLVTIKKAT